MKYTKTAILIAAAALALTSCGKKSEPMYQAQRMTMGTVFNVTVYQYSAA